MDSNNTPILGMFSTKQSYCDVKTNVRTIFSISTFDDLCEISFFQGFLHVYSSLS